MANEREIAAHLMRETRLCYVVSGAVVGVFVGGLGVCVAYSIYHWDLYQWELAYPEDMRHLARWTRPYFDSVIMVAYPMIAAILGSVAGLFMAIASLGWQTLKHPVGAASMSASVVGTLLLVFVGCTVPIQEATANFAQLGIQLATIIALAALHGFMTTLIAQRLLRWCADWVLP